MVEPDEAGWVDEHIATALCRVGMRASGQLAARQLLRVGPPGARPPQIPQARVVHAVGVVQGPIAVNEDWPRDLHVLDVRPHEPCGLEGHHRNSCSQLVEGLLVLLQLQQVPAAGQSTEVSMKHEQQPRILIVFETMHAARSIRKLERRRGLTSTIPCESSSHAQYLLSALT